MQSVLSANGRHRLLTFYGVADAPTGAGGGGAGGGSAPPAAAPAAAPAPSSSAPAVATPAAPRGPLPPGLAIPPGLSHPDAARAAASAAPPGTPPAKVAVAAASEWSAEQQKLLEAALQQFPASVGAERWVRIAESVPGKTKGECVKRYKEIVAALKAKKTAAAAPPVAVQ